MGNLKVLILTDARVVPLDKVAAAIARADPVPLDVCEAQNA